MSILTVFTPTFNRGYCLNQCYESLKHQSNKNFVWLIIDDGSTDNTRDLVHSWISEDIIKIRYHWQENQGMHGAHNTAYELIDTELNVCIDSDDYMPRNAVENIISFWEKFGNEKVSGIIGLDAYTDGTIIGSKFPKDIKSSTLYDIYNKYGLTGDKKLVYRTELTKKFPYPIFKGEKYVGLAYKYHKIDENYKLLLMNEVLCNVEYLPDGSSLNMLTQYRKNPIGFAFYRKELMKLPYSGVFFKIRHAIHYVSSSLLMKNIRFIKESPNKFITIISIPAGTLFYLYILCVTNEEKEEGK